MNPAKARKPRRILPRLPWRRHVIETGPVRLGASRLYILPTRAGLVYAALMLGLLVGAINYGVSLAYLFTFWFAGLGVVAMLHTQRNLSGLVLQACATPPVFAGETAVFSLRLDNPGHLTRRRIAIRHAEGADEPGDASAGGEARIQLRLPQARRGWHTPGRFALFSEFPLGLFRCWSVLELDWGVLVYPAPARDALPLPANGPDDGNEAESSLARQGDGADFAGLRGYQPGDPPRRIAWKAVARGGQGLLTKQFASTGGRSLWLDWRQTPEREVEARLSRLTRWVLDAHGAGLAFGLRLPGRVVLPQLGEAHLRQCLEALALHGAGNKA